MVAQITPLPTPPQRNDPANFGPRGDVFMAAMPTFAAEANVLAQEANQAAVTATEQAVIATNKAGEASDSAQAAADSKTAAQGYADNLATLDALWLGAATSDPTTGKSGTPLVEGNAYINSVTGYLRAYNGSEWVQGISAVAGVSSLNGLTGPLTGFVTESGTQALANKTLTDPQLLFGGGQGEAGQVPISQGPGLPPAWGLPSSAHYQEFLTSGTWMKPDGVTFVAFHIVAAGGSGRNNGRGACGGQGLFFILPAGLVPASSAVIVGASTSANGGNSEFLGFVAKGGTAETGSGSYYLFYHGRAPSSPSALDLLVESRGLIESFGSTSEAGRSIYGGGGGSGSPTESNRGLSTFAGNGGLQNEPGQFPGGGAGASTTAAIVPGANGVVRVWSW